MKTMAPDAPTSQTSARCKASTPGAAVIDGSDPPAVAAYAITHSRNSTNYGIAISVIASAAKKSIYPSVALWIASPSPRNDDHQSTQYAFSFLVINASGVLSRM